MKSGLTKQQKKPTEARAHRALSKQLKPLWATPEKQQLSDEPQQPATTGVANISDAVRTQVADWTIETSVMVFITLDNDPESGEEATPVP